MFDIAHLKTFLAVAQTRHFTEAAKRLGLSQSTVSQHVSKLEAAAGRRLLLRDTHAVGLTADGEAMVGFARGMLDIHERAERHFTGSELRGKLRFGVGEDLVLSRLPEILREFVRANPHVDLELTVGLSAYLYDKQDGGELDLVFAKRRKEDDRGRLIWREKLAWVGGKGFHIEAGQPIPLIVFQPPSITRDHAIETLEQAGLPWRIACTSGSFNGLMAATIAGLGVTAQAKPFVPSHLEDMSGPLHLPDLGEVEFVVVQRKSGGTGPARALASVILANSDRLQTWVD
jgi:DNA-binding transcriptional LysR family regulator